MPAEIAEIFSSMGDIILVVIKQDLRSGFSVQ
jgi:hypothetical protein